MTAPVHPSAADARKARWFSRRHRDANANRIARENYALNRGRKARKRRADERNAS